MCSVILSLGHPPGLKKSVLVGKCDYNPNLLLCHHTPTPHHETPHSPRLLRGACERSALYPPDRLWDGRPSNMKAIYHTQHLKPTKTRTEIVPCQPKGGAKLGPWAGPNGRPPDYRPGDGGMGGGEGMG